AGPGAPPSSVEVRSLFPSAPAASPTDLVVSVSDDPDPARDEEMLTYTITVRNDGFATATGVALGTLPAHTTTVSAEGCTIGGGSAQCALGSLGGGQSATRQVMVRVDSGFAGTVALTATATSTTADPEPANDSETEQTTVGRRKADLHVRLSDSADPVAPGQLLTYRIAVENLGPNPAENVLIADHLPAGVAFVSAIVDGGHCTRFGPVVVCAGGSLASGATATATIVVKVARGTRTGAVLVDLAAAASSIDDPNPWNNAARETTTLVR
ncbi:MAG: DUF11 domain-containing protein, partial [Chloroflexi bacterium]|nr:DUF11 domain-containing protein [Chloroflexota bacterium]